MYIDDMQPSKIKLREHRKAKELSAIAMAGRLGIERESYYRLERHPEKLSAGELAELADALNVEPEALWRFPEARPDTDALQADRLMRLREAMGIPTQTAMATALGIQLTRWNNMERGQAPLSMEVAIKICRRFPGVTLDWLVLGNPSGLPVHLAERLVGRQL